MNTLWNCDVCGRDSDIAQDTCRICGKKKDSQCSSRYKRLRELVDVPLNKGPRIYIDGELIPVADCAAASPEARAAATTAAVARIAKGIDRELFGEEEEESESDEDEDEDKVAAVEAEEDDFHPAKKHCSGPVLFTMADVPSGLDWGFYNRINGAPAAASDPVSTVTPPPFVMELKEWDELSDAERALWHTKEGYYSLLKMYHPTHVSPLEDARKARRAADEALVRLAVSGHPDASRADAASALDRLLSQLDRFSSLIE